MVWCMLNSLNLAEVVATLYCSGPLTIIPAVDLPRRKSRAMYELPRLFILQAILKTAAAV